MTALNRWPFRVEKLRFYVHVGTSNIGGTVHALNAADAIAIARRLWAIPETENVVAIRKD